MRSKYATNNAQFLPGTATYSKYMNTARPIQWSPSIMDTIANRHFIPYSEVSVIQELLVYFRYAWYCVIGLLSTL